MKRAKRHSKKTNLRQQAFNRFMLIVAILVIWIGGIGARLVYLQVRQHDWLRDRAEKQRIDVRKSKLPRGTIFDRDGRVLAMSVSVKTLYADATEIDDTAATAKAVARLTGADKNQLQRVLNEGKESERRFVPLVRGLDEEAAQRLNKGLETLDVKKADLPKYAGLHWRDEQTRSYPGESLAAHVIGFSNADGVGQAGIEQSQNDLLYGAVIKRVQERDRLGRVYDETISEKEPPKDVVLTIKSSIQYKVELPLAEAVRNAGAKSGMAIVLDHKTGEILALANYPTFDPNQLKSISNENLTNRAVQNVYSPGSVFKLITYGTALERNLISPDGTIDKGNGTIDVAGHVFKDHGGGGTVTYTKALAQSSNVSAIKTGLKVGKENFYSSLQKFGFGKSTGIELPAETGGIVRNPARWNGDSLASMSIGYEIGVTALQMASAFATIANDGVRIQPRIIKEIRQFDEKIGSTTEPAREQVVSAESARKLRQMLREVVVSGTGKRAAVSGYSIAGKTGTAWKFDEKLKRVNSAKYMSSFIGFAPADDPQVTIAVIIDEPKIGGRDGGMVAAPVFSKIAEDILPELNIRPDLATETLVAENDEAAQEPTADDLFTGLVGDEVAVEKNIASDSPKVERSESKKLVVRPEKAEEAKGTSTPAKLTQVKPAAADRPRVINKPEKGPEVKRKT
ncbi:MAG: penicillin-binding protein 2 [Pyrinomonadaceae bacterium]|nr:penicillin-binding protein 2 [Blastocatellia bacterium]MCW5958117.1 penicillin-binding protein 2 [Pyrinomonadaceae bacterium]